MRNSLKTATIESKLPLLSVEQECIISKNADITAVFQVELPELFTITEKEYEAMHSVWCKAIRILPDYCVVHKQDWFVKEKYSAEINRDNQSFLSRASELHFNERPYLHHSCFLYLTKTTKEQSRKQSISTSLCRNFIVPKEINPEAISRFLESVGQFEQIINDSGYIRLKRLMGDELTGTENAAGLIEKYFSLSLFDTTALKDVQLNPENMKIGDNTLCLHTFSDIDDLPNFVNTDSCYERLSTDRSECRLSFAAPVGLLLPCNHIYNQYIFIDNSDEILQTFEKRAKNLYSLSRYSRANAINKEWIDLFLNEAHSYGLTAVRCHANILAWSENENELKQIKNDTGSAIAQLGIKPRHNTVDVPALYWAGIPGVQGDFPSEESFYTFLEQSICLFNGETNYRSSLSPCGLKMCDRNGKPLHLDISDEPMKKGIINNRNKVILGGSGSGKSFFMNHLVRQYYEQGTHILLIDTGNSYQGLCELIHKQTNGEDGIYITYKEEEPITFNPFYTDDYIFDVEKRESIKTLIFTLWKKETELTTKAEENNLSTAIGLYIKKIQADRSVTPCFDTFYEFMQTEYSKRLKEKNVQISEFNLHNFLNVLEPYYKGGEYDYLLNSTQQLDLLNKRFIVFELDNIKDNKTLLPITTIIIMETFLSKMRRLKGVRKMMIIEEAWKAIASPNMAEYIRYLYKTARKYFGEIFTVSQEIEDIISSPIVKESIINNSDCKILLDQRKYINKFGRIQEFLGLTDKEKAQILSINQALNPTRKYKEVFISLGGTHSNVYATEVSPEEYYAYSTEQTEKVELYRLSDEMGGNLEKAIKQMADQQRNPNQSH